MTEVEQSPQEQHEAYFHEAYRLIQETFNLPENTFSNHLTEWDNALASSSYSRRNLCSPEEMLNNGDFSDIHKSIILVKIFCDYPKNVQWGVTVRGMSLKLQEFLIAILELNIKLIIGISAKKNVLEMYQKLKLEIEEILASTTVTQ